MNQAIVTGVLRREPTIDFQTAFTAGLQGVKDPEVLAIAAQQGRILVSHDHKTMPSEFAEFITNNQSSGQKNDYIQVAIAPDDKAAFDAWCAANNLTMSEVIRSEIATYIAKGKKLVAPD